MNIITYILSKKTKKTLTAISIILSTFVFADDSHLNKTINTDLLNLKNGDEILEFIKIYTVKDYIDGDFKNNIFSYDPSKYKKLKRKDKKSSIYNIEIVKTNLNYEHEKLLENKINTKDIDSDSYINESYDDKSYDDGLYSYEETIEEEKINKKDNFIKFDDGYLNITKKQYNLYKTKDLKKTIDKNYKISNEYGKIDENGISILDVNKLIDYYLISKIGIDMNINQVLNEKAINTILKNKLNIINNNESITIDLCLKHEHAHQYEDEDEDENYTKINIGNYTYYLFLNESCYGGAHSKTEKLIESLRDNIDIENNTNVIDFNFNEKYNIVSFNLKNNKNFFLKIGKYFTKDGEIFINKFDKNKKYIYIKTTEDNLEIMFAKFLINKNCLIYSFNKTKIELCNFKNNKEVNEINSILNIF